MKNRTILITGGAGFLGRNLVECLCESNHVIVIDNSRQKIAAIAKSKRIQTICCDAKEINNISLPKRIDYVFHLAAIVGVDRVSKDPESVLFDEVSNIQAIVKFALRHKSIRRIVYSSSSSVYGDTSEKVAESTRKEPIGTYGAAKLLAEKYLQEKLKGVCPFNIFRFFNLYGPYQKDEMVTMRFFKQAMSESPITVFGNGTQTRDFTYVTDAADAIIKIAEMKRATNETFNIGTGIEHPINQLAHMITNMTNSTSRIMHFPAPKARMTYEIKRRCCNPNKLKMFGLRVSIPLSVGLKRTYDWLIQQEPTDSELTE